VLYLFIVKDPKLPSTGIVPQSSLLETSLQSWNVKSDDIQINHEKNWHEKMVQDTCHVYQRQCKTNYKLGLDNCDYP
jgi:hypothetical protein